MNQNAAPIAITATMTRNPAIQPELAPHAGSSASDSEVDCTSVPTIVGVYLS